MNRSAVLGTGTGTGTVAGSRAVAGLLAGHGVDTVFALPGDGNVFVDHVLVHEHGVRYVTAVREDGAVAMADAFARVTGRLGVASITHGPGLTNALTALTTAARRRTPLLVVTGEAPDGHLQAIDQRRLVEVTGAAFRRLDDGARLTAGVADAVGTCLVERRPTVLVVPPTLQHAEVPAPGPVDALEVRAAPAPPPRADEVDAAVAVIAAARRPLVLAGAGAVGARDAVLRLAERIGAPVGTTLLAKDLFAGEPSDLGVVGGLATDAAAVARDADCVIAFGADLNAYTTGDGALLTDAALVHCDLDPTAVGRCVPATAGVVGDAAAVAARMQERLDALGVPPAAGRADPPPAPAAPRGAPPPPGRGVDMRCALEQLNSLLPAERTVAVDGGRFLRAPVTVLDVPEPSALLWTLGFGSIGLGLAAAIGGAVGRPDRTAVAVVGDGGFMMSLAELSTAVRQNVDLVVVVLDDGGYGAEYDKLRERGEDPSLVLFEWPDLAGVARAFGATGIVVEDLGAGLRNLSDALAHRTGPLVIDVRCDPASPMSGTERSGS